MAMPNNKKNGYESIATNEPTASVQVYSEQNPDPVAQRKAILDLIRAGAHVGEIDKNGVTPLHHAVRFRSSAGVQALIGNGASVNQPCKRSGSTPLHRAVLSTGAPGTAGKQSEARQIVALLLAAGTDHSMKNKQGKTPVDYATDEAMRKLLTNETSA